MAEQTNSVLVVEDPTIRRLLTGILTRAGFSVTEAEPWHGVNYLREQLEFDLLITNSPTPFLEFADRIPVLYMAASPDPKVAACFRKCAMLQKPFRPSDLVALAGELAGSL